MNKTELNIPSIWGGTFIGYLLKNDTFSETTTTTKIICIHGWLDNLNSLLPLAEKLIDRHPSEIHFNSSEKQSLFPVLKQIMKSVYMIALVMDFLVIYLKGLSIPMHTIFEIFVLLFKVSFSLLHFAEFQILFFH